MSTSTGTSQQQQQQQQKYKLSYVSCRSRKIRCERTHPCSHCVKAGTDCVFPARKRMHRPQKTKNSELLNHISRLESIIGKVGTDDLNDTKMSDLEAAAAMSASSPSPGRPMIHPFLRRGADTPSDRAVVSNTSVAHSEDRASRYLSCEF